MNWRNMQRTIGRVVRAATIPDNGIPQPPEKPFILYSCHDADRSMVESGLRFSPLVEGVRQLCAELGYEGVNLSHPLSAFPGRQIKDGSITLNYKALGNRVTSKTAKLFGTDNDALSLETDLYISLLAKLTPNVVISIQPPAGLCLAARHMGIQVIEVMHGSNYSLTDPIYLAHMSQPDAQLPNVLLTFDEVSEANLSTLCAGRDISVVRTSNPWTHALRRRKAQPQMQPPKKNKRIIVTMQWGYDGEREAFNGIVPNGVLHPAIEEAFGLLEKQGVEFLLRLHPIQINRPGYRHHRRHAERVAERYSNVRYHGVAEEPLPLLFDDVDGHLTMSSASVGEASAAGVPSLALCPTLQPNGAFFGMFRELEAAGSVTFGTLEAHAIANWVDALPLRQATAALAPDRHAEELAFYAQLLDKATGAISSRPGLGGVARV